MAATTAAASCLRRRSRSGPRRQGGGVPPARRGGGETRVRVPPRGRRRAPTSSWARGTASAPHRGGNLRRSHCPHRPHRPPPPRGRRRCAPPSPLLSPPPRGGVAHRHRHLAETHAGAAASHPPCRSDDNIVDSRNLQGCCKGSTHGSRISFGDSGRRCGVSDNLIILRSGGARKVYVPYSTTLGCIFNSKVKCFYLSFVLFLRRKGNILSFFPNSKDVLYLEEPYYVTGYPAHLRLIRLSVCL